MGRMPLANELVSASAATLVQIDHKFAIRGVNGAPTILLGDHPFKPENNPVWAKLKLDNHHGTEGACQITAHKVHDRSLE
jgi:hypothetical protein